MPDTNANPVPVLSDDEVQSVAVRESVVDRSGESLVVLRTIERDALCATVRALRVSLAQAEQAFELESAVRLPEVGNLNILQIVKKLAELHESNTALREQLTHWQDRTRERTGEVERL